VASLVRGQGPEHPKAQHDAHQHDQGAVKTEEKP